DGSWSLNTNRRPRRPAPGFGEGPVLAGALVLGRDGACIDGQTPAGRTTVWMLEFKRRRPLKSAWTAFPPAPVVIGCRQEQGPGRLALQRPQIGFRAPPDDSHELDARQKVMKRQTNLRRGFPALPKLKRP